jgi:hypothetical protein
VSGIVAGSEFLDAAYKIAQERKEKSLSTEARMERIRDADGERERRGFGGPISEQMSMTRNPIDSEARGKLRVLKTRLAREYSRIACAIADPGVQAAAAALVLKSGASRPVSHISSILRAPSSVRIPACAGRGASSGMSPPE